MPVFFENFLTYLKSIFQGLLSLRHFRLSSLRKVFSFLGRREKVALWTLAAAAAASLFFSSRNYYYAHTTVAPTFGGIYTEGLLGQPSYINPLFAHQDTDLALTHLVFSGLYKYDSSGQLVPDLADGQPVISEDQKQYTVNLKHNVKWHNDKPFTADDVVFTVLTLQDPSSKSPLRNSWLSTTVEKLSDYQVRFTTKDISGPFAANLTMPIISKAVWSHIDPQNYLVSTANLQAVGTGPYAIKEIKKEASGRIEQVTLESYSSFYTGKSKIDTVIMKFYDSDEDLLNALHGKEIQGLGFTALDRNLFLDQDRSDVNMFRIPLPQYQVIFFNLANKTLADQNVRKALQAAIDRTTIIQDVFKGNAALPVSPLLGPAASTSPASANLDQARALLDQAGWKVDSKTNIRTKKNVQLELTIATNDYQLNSKAAEDVANEWKKLNIKANLTVLPTKQLTDTAIRPRKFDVLLFPQKFGADPDPFAFWHSSQIKDPGLNLTGFSDANVDKLIVEARSTTNDTSRTQKYQQLDALVSDATPVIFLDQALYVYALPTSIKNASLTALTDPSERFYDITNWYIDEKRVWKH